MVKIKGQKGDVDCCYKYLSELVKDLNENNFTVKVPIYKQFHKCIIGRGGNNIKKVRFIITIDKIFLCLVFKYFS